MVLLREEFASHMVPRQKNAAMRDVPTMLRREECVSHMAQRWRRSDAALRGVTIKSRREAYASHMVPRRKKDAAMRGVQTAS
jgi:hypothetical protein